MDANNLVPVMEWETRAAEAAGVTVSLLRFAAAFFASVPINIALPWVPTVRGRHLYSLLTGLLLIYYPFGNGCLHVLVPSLCTYVVMARLRQHCGTLSWLVTFPYLLVCHALNASAISWKEGALDFTGAQMVLTLKVIAVAVAYQDGLRPPHLLRRYPAAKRVQALPSPLEYLAYLLASGNLLAGPFFEFADYKACTERTGDWARPLPSPWVPGTLRFLKGCAYMGLYLSAGAAFGPQLLEGERYSGQHGWYRVVVLMVVSTCYRFRYYFAWAISETCLIFNGLCFNGYRGEEAGAQPQQQQQGGEATDKAAEGISAAAAAAGEVGAATKGAPRWDRYINARIRRIETCTSAARLAAEWNICTGNWLRHYVYDRLTPPGRKPTFFTLLATQLISGVWHGLYPGYALFFASLAFFFESSRVLYRYEAGLLPGWLARSWPWALAKWAYTLFTLNYLAASFIVLEFWEAIAVWRLVGFAGHAAMAVILFFGWTVPPPRKGGGGGRGAQAGASNSNSNGEASDGSGPSKQD